MSSLKYLLLACPLVAVLAPPALADKALSPSPEQNFFYSRLQPEALPKPEVKPKAKRQSAAAVEQRKDDAAKDASLNAQAPPPPPNYTVNPRFTLHYGTAGAGSEPVVGFQGFTPVSQVPGSRLTFVEGKLLLATPDSGLSGTVILGHRFLTGGGDRSLGGYLAYDYRKTEEATYSQIGLGLESLSEKLDLRLNGYLPVGNTSRELATGFNGLAFFQGNALQVGRTRLFQSALGGVDAEVGTKLMTLGKTGYLRGYAGTYFYVGENIANVVGVRGRLEARLVDQLTLNLGIQHDSLFDTRITFGLDLSLGKVPALGVDRSTAIGRFGNSIDRQPTIAIARENVEDVITAQDANTNQPINFFVVDPARGSGQGTFENPFQTVAQARAIAKPGDVVLIQSKPGDAAPTFTGAELSNLTGISLLSSGPSQLVNTNLGEVPLPNTNTGVFPQVTGTITLAGSSSLGGFDITPGAGRGIQGTNLPGTVSITDNMVRNAGSDGIAVFNNTGIANLNIARNTVTNPSGVGILIQSLGDAQVNGTAANNVITNSQGSGIRFFTLDNAQVSAKAEGNVISGNIASAAQDGGIRIGSFNYARVSAIANNNTIKDNQSTGIFIGSENNAEVNAVVSNNKISNNFGNGIFLGAQNDSGETGLIVGNTVTGNKVNPSFPFPPNAPSGNGIFFGSVSNGRTNASIQNNITNDNEASGIYGFVANTGTATGDILNNNSSNNGASGIEINVGVNAPPAPPSPPGPPPPLPPIGTLQGTFNIAGNVVTNNRGEGPPNQGGGGISVRTFNNTVAKVVIVNNTATNNATAPGAFAQIGLTALDNSELRARVEQNTLTSADPNVPGFNAQAVKIPNSTTTSKLCLKVSNNTSNTPFVLYRSPGAQFNADLGDASSTNRVVAMAPAPLTGQASTTYTGVAQPIGNGQVSTFLTTDAAGAPAELGFKLNATALTGLPDADTLRAQGSPTAQIAYNFNAYANQLSGLPLPPGAPSTPYQHLITVWNPIGHPPAEGGYEVPGLEFNFFSVSGLERASIAPPTNPNGVTPLAQYLAAGYTAGANPITVPQVGVVTVNPSDPNFQGQPLTTSIVDFFNNGVPSGKSITIAKDYLQTQPNVTIPLSQPPTVLKDGYYATSYRVNYDAATQVYTVALTGFVFRAGTPPPPGGNPPQGALIIPFLPPDPLGACAIP